jgi:hypothetical protein
MSGGSCIYLFTLVVLVNLAALQAKPVKPPATHEEAHGRLSLNYNKSDSISEEELDEILKEEVSDMEKQKR